MTALCHPGCALPAVPSFVATFCVLFLLWNALTSIIMVGYTAFEERFHFCGKPGKSSVALVRDEPHKAVRAEAARRAVNPRSLPRPSASARVHCIALLRLP